MSHQTPTGASPFTRACAKACMCVVDWVVSLVGPILASLATFLIFFVTYCYFTELLPVIVIHHGHSYAQAVTLFGVFILTNLLWNYFSTMFVGPGHAPDVMPDMRESLNLLNGVRDPEADEGHSHRFCRKCNRVKPMRAHHCSICNKCVLKMDHHCPWVNNCVGHNNHKYFMGFLAYMCTGAGFVLFVSFESTLAALSGRNQSAVFLISTVMCFSAFVATGLFFSWNAYLVISNQTTIEFYGNKFSQEGRKRGNPYDLGWRKNLAGVFGTGFSVWTFLIPNRTKPAGDGIIYEMRPGTMLRSTNGIHDGENGFPRPGGRLDASISL